MEVWPSANLAIVTNNSTMLTEVSAKRNSANQSFISEILLLFTLYITYIVYIVVFSLLLKSNILAARNLSSPTAFHLES